MHLPSPTRGMFSTQPVVHDPGFHAIGLFALAFWVWAACSVGTAFPSPGQHKLCCGVQREQWEGGEPCWEHVTEPGRKLR